MAPRSGSSARKRAASLGKRQLRMTPLSAPIAGSPGSPSVTTSPSRVITHSRAEPAPQPSTAARAVADSARISSRARPSAPSGSAERASPAEPFPTNTMAPAAGSFGSAAASETAVRTAASSDSGALSTRPADTPRREVNSAARACVSASESANTNQLPEETAAPTAGSELSSHVLSKIFCSSASCTAAGSTWRSSTPASSAVTVPASSVRMIRPVRPCAPETGSASCVRQCARRPTGPNTRSVATPAAENGASSGESAGTAAASAARAEFRSTGWMQYCELSTTSSGRPISVRTHPSDSTGSTAGPGGAGATTATACRCQSPPPDLAWIST